MNVTFLIGNGFDLACGMKTSYPDVYEGYIKIPSETPVIAQFKQDLIDEKTKENWGNWSDFEMGMANYAKKFKNEQDFIACIADFKKYLKIHLMMEELRFAEKWEKVKKNWDEEIEEILRLNVEEYYRGVSKSVEQKAKATQLIGGRTEFVSFNYTDALDKVLDDGYPGEVKIFHIHGTLSEGDMILGADNVEQIKTSFDLSSKGKRMFVKPFLNEEYDIGRVEQVKKLIEASDCICVFGLSLGDSDLTWKDEIIQWLKTDYRNQLFLFEYDCSKIMIDDVALRLNEEEDQKSARLLKKGICDVDAPIFEQIHIPIGVKIFDIQAIIDESLKGIKKTA